MQTRKENKMNVFEENTKIKKNQLAHFFLTRSAFLFIKNF